MVKLPKNPTKEMLLIFQEIVDDKKLSFEKSRKIAIKEQKRLGFEVVPPNFEMELAAVIYRLLYNHLKEKQ